MAIFGGQTQAQWGRGDGFLDKKMVVNMHMEECSHHVSQSIISRYYDESGAALDWFVGASKNLYMAPESYAEIPADAQANYMFPYMYPMPETYDYNKEDLPCYPTSVGFSSLATVMADNLQAAVDAGAEVRYSTKGVELILNDEGAVAGIYAQAAGSDGYIKINASKGTVVCTGGYARNEDMLKALQPQTLNKYSLSIAIDGTTGDGIKSCLWAGARMDEVHTAMVFDRVAVKPDEFGGAQTTGSLFWMGSNPWLKVNLNGERFANESGPYDYILNAALTQPNHTVVDIWDSDYETYLEQFDIHGCARVYPFENGAPTNMTLETVKGINEGLLADGYIVKADTIEELAKGLGLPVENLKKTVDRQNENYDNQVDPDFGKEAFRLSPVRKAPFYGVRTSGYMLCTLDGITINENFQAVNEEGEAIEGLYVTGVDSGSYYAHTYPNMSTGNCCGRSVTFARMIGKALAAK